MSLMSRISNGWTIASNSWKVLRENKRLIILPVLSTISLIVIIGSFLTVTIGFYGWDAHIIQRQGTVLQYAIIFGFYIVNYFIVMFFNVALVYCVSMYFKGEKVSVKDGIQFSISRIGTIFSWAVFAGSVGAVLKIIQENVGSLGKILTGLIGIVWSIATFFVIPVIAYENLGPVAAFKRSAQIMKDKWGERIGAGFSFGLITLAGLVIIGIVAFGVAAAIHPFVGIAVGVLGVASLMAIMSALRTIFISAVYHNINGDPVELYNQQFIDNLFVSKKK